MVLPSSEYVCQAMLFWIQYNYLKELDAELSQALAAELAKHILLLALTESQVSE